MDRKVDGPEDTLTEVCPTIFPQWRNHKLIEIKSVKLNIKSSLYTNNVSEQKSNNP